MVTDSFHGTVFSILFNKPFMAHGNPQTGTGSLYFAAEECSDWRIDSWSNQLRST